jgi:thiamine biosynthesis lipoprotein
MNTKVTRRRFISIAAAFGGSSFLVGAESSVADAEPNRPLTWRGSALGAEAEIQLYNGNHANAEHALVGCRKEIARLEALFSLYRSDSAINTLNREGSLDHPDSDVLNLLSRAASVSALTAGAFDITIQPLWSLYASHFSTTGADPAGPKESEIARTLALIGWDGVELSTKRIGFARRGMAITLNGIAQGFITDRIAQLLRRDGYENVFVQLGESYAMGRHADGRPWRVGIGSPNGDGSVLTSVSLENRALATSGGYGSPFSQDGQHHHLFDPQNGRSANHYRSVSVLAPDATTADALSTALAVTPRQHLKRTLANFSDVRVFLSGNDGELGWLTQHKSEEESTKADRALSGIKPTEGPALKGSRQM